MIPPTFTEETKREFDEKFGKAGPERNSDSVGRRAGCDDCSTSIEIRDEHRDFLLSRTQAAYELGFNAGRNQNTASELEHTADKAELFIAGKAQGRAETLKEVREMCGGMIEILGSQGSGGDEKQDKMNYENMLRVEGKNKALSDLLSRLTQ